MIVARVPASSANLGPGFDALGMALTLPAEIGSLDVGEAVPERARVVDERHPAAVAFRRGGGLGPLWIRSSIPMGRGLGFSGAARVGGLAVALAQRHGAEALPAARHDVLAVAAELEGHADNVAASLFGGVVATAGGRVVPVPLALAPAVVAWIPPFGTSTDRSRTVLPSTVSRADATFNIGRTALLVAALVTGDVAALPTATEDRLHQDLRFAATVPSRAALADGLAAGAWCGWLSGSGPAVVLLCEPALAATVGASLPVPGHVEHLAIDASGVTVTVPGS